MYIAFHSSMQVKHFTACLMSPARQDGNALQMMHAHLSAVLLTLDFG